MLLLKTHKHFEDLKRALELCKEQISENITIVKVIDENLFIALDTTEIKAYLFYIDNGVTMIMETEEYYEDN